MEIVIGVDPHKATNVVAAIYEQGELVGQETFPANRKGQRTLQRSKQSASRGTPLWAVEDAGGIGRSLAQKLLAAGYSPKLVMVGGLGSLVSSSGGTEQPEA
jgi:transposase